MNRIVALRCTRCLKEAVVVGHVDENQVPPRYDLSCSAISDFLKKHLVRSCTGTIRFVFVKES